MSFQRSIYDQCAYAHRVRESMSPGNYRIEQPKDDVGPVGGSVRPDDFMMLQGYGRSICPQGTNVSAESDILGYTQRVSRCPEDGVKPAPADAVCVNKSYTPARREYTPTEATRLSNPSCTLRGAGINRFHALCSNPQEWCKINSTVPLGTSSRILAKDNHVACLQEQLDSTKLLPPGAGSDDVDAWVPEDSMFRFKPNENVPGEWYDDSETPDFAFVQTGYPSSAGMA